MPTTAFQFGVPSAHPFSTSSVTVGVAIPLRCSSATWASTCPNLSARCKGSASSDRGGGGGLLASSYSATPQTDGEETEAHANTRGKKAGSSAGIRK